MKRTIFRDRATGRFVSGSTWKRSKAHSGTRYVRQRIEVKPKPKAPQEPPREVEEEEIRVARRRAEEEEEIEEEEEFEPYDLEGSADYEEPE